jgi:hypothetical protein
VKAHLRWAKGGEASFQTVADDAVTLCSTTPSPPGARLEGTLVDGSLPVKVKVHGSKLEADGTYTIRGKLLEANRPFRDHIASLVNVELVE